MENMEWFKIIGSLIATISTVLITAHYLRKDVKEVKVEAKENKAEVKQEVREVKQEVKEIRGEVKEVRGEVEKVKGDVKSNWFMLGKLSRYLSPKDEEDFDDAMQYEFARGTYRTAEGQSPKVLNQKGFEVAENMQAASIVDKYYNRILIPDDADELAIQNACFKFAWHDLLQAVDAEETKAIRKSIYQDVDHPEDVYIVFGILFRDKILELRGMEVPKSSEAPVAARTGS